MASAGRSIVVFDLGGVLIDWNPRHLYRKLFAGDEAAMENFLATVCTHEWHRHHDSGRSFAEGARLLKELHPDKAELIDAFGTRQGEMMAGPIAGTVEMARERFDFLGWFRGIVLSGEIGAIKPQPRIYEVLLERFAIDPSSAIFIDDSEANAVAARPFGIHAIHFTNPAALRAELVALGLL